MIPGLAWQDCLSSGIHIASLRIESYKTCILRERWERHLTAYLCSSRPVCILKPKKFLSARVGRRRSEQPIEVQTGLCVFLSFGSFYNIHPSTIYKHNFQKQARVKKAIRFGYLI
jgi:hypothetical protein